MTRFSAFLLVSAAVPAVAQQAQPGDVVVTGRGLDERLADRALDVVTIDRARIEANAANRLESVLADVAGLQQFRRADSRSANPTAQGISLRGIGGNASSRALLVLDGVPQADPFGGWVAFPAYATNRLGEVRVTRGGGSGYFGPGALAGIVELESAAPDQLAAVEAAGFYGSRDSVDAQAAATLERPGGFATLSAAYAWGNGFVPIVREDRGSVDRRAPYEQASAAVRGVVEVAPATELQANMSVFTDTRERGTVFTGNRSEGADVSVRVVGRGRWGWSALAYLQTRAFASSFAGVNATRTTATQTLDQYGTPATGLGARVEIAPPLGRGVDLRLGADWRDVEGRTQENFTFVNARPTRRRVAGGENRTVGLFADGAAELGAFTVTLGGRVDRWRIADGFLSERPLAGGAALTDLKFRDRSGEELTGRAGLAWRPADALTLRAAAYRGWRLPTLNELYRPFRVGADAVAANAELAPERLEGVEGGVTLAPARGVTLAATVFHNRLEGAVANVTAGRGPGVFPGVGFVAAGGVYRVRRNLDAIVSTGVEFDARAELGPVFAQASWSRVDPRVEASGAAAALDGLRPAQTPRDLLSATFGWRKGQMVVSGTIRHAARQFEDDQNTRDLASATTLDTFASVPLARGLSLEARAENLLDERVETANTGAEVVERATPRTIWVGLRFRGG
ncbi:TonB-dependent receptor [Sphingomonas lenta]|uniref:TonB-dependent receptor n=1 Tax=Sphingomonas lenta TaxID=1141887 RepID=A0A2A2SIA5_9SPHN|nr:TonB-dependent receptor [Sphingomonas lenta]PAX09007.1 TonB-dependent receptor [Sphingomonas lenta]